MRVVVTGARGMLGSTLLPCLNGEHEVTGVDSQEFDITREDAVQNAFRELQPQFVFHLAAYTNVDACEANPWLAREVNTLGTRHVARACADTGAVLLYVSTDYVFDGSLARPYREDDPPHPLSAYGVSKLGGEQHVQALVRRHFIVRSSWLFGPRGKNFVSTILKLAAEGKQIRVVDDQLGSPTYTLHLARALASMSQVGSYGVYHVTGSGACTWFEFARTVLEFAGMDPARVAPISTLEFGRPAPRPANSVMENRRLRVASVAALPDWKQGLAAYLEEGRRLGEFQLAPESGSAMRSQAGEKGL